MTQPIEEIEAHYNTPDPWGYQTHPDDLRRKQIILDRVYLLGPFEKALDIGAGEGWITRDLPAKVKHAYEISEQAKQRLPEGVIGVSSPDPSYDLIIATGVMYPHYDYKLFIDLIQKHASLLIVTCNIKEWEVPEMAHIEGLEQINEIEFPYREYTQKLRVFQKI